MRIKNKSFYRSLLALSFALAILVGVNYSAASLADAFAWLTPAQTPASMDATSGEKTEAVTQSTPCIDVWDSRFGTLGANGDVWSIARDASGNIYAGGDFTAIGGVVANRIAKWNGTGWTSLGSGVDGLVTSVAVSGSDVFVAGDFAIAGGNSATRIAKWNGTSWSALGSGLNDTVWSIEVSGSDLYAGGEFTSAGGVTANRVARWNGSGWTAMGTGANGVVWALEAVSGGVIAGGSFSSAGGVASTGGIARWNGTSWSALGSGFGSGEVHAIAEDQGVLYAGGRISASGATTLSNVASWNGTAWSPLGTGIASGVIALAAGDGNLYASTDFRGAVGTPTEPTLRWNGTSWSSLGAGTDFPVNALLVSGGSLYAGGFFDRAGCRMSNRFGRIYENGFAGTGGTDWHTSSNWSGGAIPSSTASALIKDADVSITSADAAVLDLQVEEGRFVDIAEGRTLTVSGVLVLNGVIRGGGTIELTSCDPKALSHDTGTGGRVAANLKRCVGAGGEYLFPTGGASGYGPVRLTNVSGQAQFTVRTVESHYSASTDLPTNRLGRYWELTNGGITSADVTFQYRASEISAGNEANYKVFRINGSSAVNVGGTIDPVAHTATVTGVTTFSPWTLAEPTSNCSYSISPSTPQSVATSGGTVNVSVTGTEGCGWSAVSNASWVTVSSGSTGTGNGSVALTVASNTGAARSGTVNIAGQTLTINQAEGCTFQISPTSSTYGASGGSGSVAVTSGTGCAWTASTQDSWITVASGSSGTGNGSVSLSVGANSGQERTGTVTVAGQTHTVTQSAAAATGSIAGTVRYYFGTSPVAVPGVTLTAAGTPQVTATTASNGTYSLTGLGGGAYTVTPSKTGGVAGIASADASRVAQYAAGLVTLTPNQLVAADASGNGTVSSLDASRIAQYIVGLNPTGATGTWKFAPVNISYSATTSQVTGEDYAAILVGDVTGNWTNPPSLDSDTAAGPILADGIPGLFGEELFNWNFDTAPVRAQSSPVDVVLGEAGTVRTGEILTIPVTVGDLSAGNVTAFDFEISFDPRILRPVNGRAVEVSGKLAANFTVTVNPNQPGVLKVSAFGTAPLAGAGELANLTFEVISTRRGSPVKWTAFTFNEGELPTRVSDGAVGRPRR
jgi:hypothetical protein